eukprot:NODE_3361_length_991_cov_45.201699_g3089_i0.p1 GENE.NODE_3361_length_991_cov_45.201699_g3089_i0~~NODE_3361_length_991_cov_45.201699_g3089_i0.p1  ORF type:complete len:270 (-),score=42.72 NODE_3361_length_991_cov_45.201699_g3089_i0:181-927(-)
MKVFLILLLCTVAAAQVELDASSVLSRIGGNDNVFLKVYAPWCGWCKKLAPVWESLAEKFEDSPNIVIAKFDATQVGSEEVTSKFAVRGFPTLLFFRAGETKPLSFTGERTIEALVNFVESSAASEDKSKFSPQELEQTTQGVVELTQESFDSVVLDPSKDVFVKFYAPWCGHCQRMAAVWDQLGEQEPDIVIAKIDASRFSEVSARHGVRGFPTLKFYSKADKSGNVVYKGVRDLASFQSFLDQQRS